MAEPNAKFITRAYLGSQKVAVSEHWLVLQASSPGTCQLTVDKSAERFTPVAFEMGWGEMIERVFYGYIERIMPAANGLYTVFCRELSSALANNLSVTLRHPTLRNVCDEIKAQVGLEFVLPDKPYANTAIPCFYGDTSGYAMLDNLGRTYKVPDFIWQQQGNGKIYLGSYQDSFWAGKDIAIPQSLMTDQQAGKTATIPAVPKLRPNVTANGARIAKVEFKGTNMTISW
ncbi:conserved hypothetical protein [Shewanella sp. W3-18-1]|uniref:hypothetical protein n=1 Tax=Shewanella sp. (strain W3-18-1) TaxID=351745 RepID=UPI00005FDB10|nr:hypothetical protein [Shewanella sp. W3-18-1]ABM25696.1 conserved hypothetical protein [Shewanella sp. W3-18-1]